MMHPTTKSSEIQGSLYWMPLVDMIAAWRASCTAMAPCKASSSISSSACCSLILLGEGHERVVVARASRHEGEKKPTLRVSGFSFQRTIRAAEGTRCDEKAKIGRSCTLRKSFLIWTNPIEAPVAAARAPSS